MQATHVCCGDTAWNNRSSLKASKIAFCLPSSSASARSLSLSISPQLTQNQNNRNWVWNSVRLFLSASSLIWQHASEMTFLSFNRILRKIAIMLTNMFQFVLSMQNLWSAMLSVSSVQEGWGPMHSVTDDIEQKETQWSHHAFLHIIWVIKIPHRVQTIGQKDTFWPHFSLPYPMLHKRACGECKKLFKMTPTRRISIACLPCLYASIY